jgi:hypothetical protein
MSSITLVTDNLNDISEYKKSYIWRSFPRQHAQIFVRSHFFGREEREDGEGIVRELQFRGEGEFSGFECSSAVPPRRSVSMRWTDGKELGNYNGKAEREK